MRCRRRCFIAASASAGSHGLRVAVNGALEHSSQRAKPGHRVSDSAEGSENLGRSQAVNVGGKEASGAAATEQHLHRRENVFNTRQQNWNKSQAVNLHLRLQNVFALGARRLQRRSVAWNQQHIRHRKSVRNYQMKPTPPLAGSWE